MVLIAEVHGAHTAKTQIVFNLNSMYEKCGGAVQIHVAQLAATTIEHLFIYRCCILILWYCVDDEII